MCCGRGVLEMRRALEARHLLVNQRLPACLLALKTSGQAHRDQDCEGRPARKRHILICAVRVGMYSYSGRDGIERRGRIYRISVDCFPSRCTISKHIAGCVLGRPHRIFGVHPPTTHQNLKDVSGETRGLFLRCPFGFLSIHRRTCFHYWRESRARAQCFISIATGDVIYGRPSRTFGFRCAAAVACLRCGVRLERDTCL
jgi:hypothetical protein